MFWLVTTYARPLLGVLGAYFLNMTSPIVVTPKRTVLGWKHVFKPFSVRIGATVKPGRVTEKKNTQKSHKSVIFPLFGGSLTGPIRPKSCVVGNVKDVITCAISNRFAWLRWVEFSICLLIFAALMRLHVSSSKQ